MILPLWLKPWKYIATVFWYMRYTVACKFCNKKNLDPFILERAADMLGTGEISRGKFRELAREWAIGMNIYDQVKYLEDTIPSCRSTDE